MIRRAVRSDVAAIVGLLADDAQGAAREDTAPSALPRYEAAFDVVAADPSCALFVAEDAGVVIGCVQVNIVTGLSFQGLSRALIEDVRVAPSHQKRGIGRMLIDVAEGFAQTHGCGMVELFVHQGRTDAHAFYTACGYQGNHRGFRKLIG